MLHGRKRHNTFVVGAQAVDMILLLHWTMNRKTEQDIIVNKLFAVVFCRQLEWKEVEDIKEGVQTGKNC